MAKREAIPLGVHLIAEEKGEDPGKMWWDGLRGLLNTPAKIATFNKAASEAIQRARSKGQMGELVSWVALGRAIEAVLESQPSEKLREIATKPSRRSPPSKFSRRRRVRVATP